MAFAPATQRGLNKDAEPWRPAAASHSPSSNVTPESPGYSQSLPMFPHYAQPCHAPFLLPHQLYRKPNFVHQPTVQPSFCTPQPVTMHGLPFVETYNTGNQAEQVQPVVPENRVRSRNRGYGQGNAPRRDRFVPDRPRNRAQKQEWRPRAGNGNAVNDTVFNGSLRNQPSRKHPENSIPLESGGQETTVMIRNIPSRYTRMMLKDFLMKHCKIENGRKGQEELQYSAFDFLYLPIDFRTNCNKGYAFVNFTNPEAAWKFSLAEENQSWDRFNSTKIRDICCAKFQGKEALVKHFEVARFPLEECQPLCFEPACDGSAGQVVKEIPIGVCTNHRG